MSETVEKTAGGATRGLLGSFSFILVMLGLEMVTDKTGIQLGLGVFLIIVGALCAYAAFFWESAKRVLSDDAQAAIGHFAQSRVTWALMIFLVLNVLIFSRFIEEHRWPFSYPADPTIIANNAKLQADVMNANAAFTREKELADKWRFANALRQRGRACGYQFQMTSNAASTAGFWQDLLRQGGWNEKASGIALAPAPGSARPGITIRISGDTGTSAQCAGVLQAALTDIYPNPPSRIATKQQSDFLVLCPDCVQIEFDY